MPQQQQQHNTAATTTTPTSPLRTAEDLASRLCLDLAVAGLERLFFSPSHSPHAPVPSTGQGGGGDPPDADPSPHRPLRVAYQGARGSYCQEATSAAFSSLPGARLATFPCAHMEDAFSALEDGAADRAVVPVENSLDGPIHRNLDLLLRHPRVEVVGELVVPVNHCLLALPGDSLPAVRRVASHPQALAHCRSRLSALGVETEEAPNAADAARALAEGQLGAGTAVVGSRAAAQEFGLVVLRENLQDPAGGGNYTRFLQLALKSTRHQLASVGRRKATVAFALERGPSELFRAMWAFESRGLAVTRVDHRPNRENPVRFVDRAGERVGYFDYVFVLDVELATADSVALDSAVERLREICEFARVLGTYACETAC